jgi:hypothetical protein
MEFIVTMGIPRKDNKEGEGHRYGKAVLQIVDWETKALKKEITYEPARMHIGSGLSRQYKGGCLYRGRFYVVTNTEVLVYDTNDWSLQAVVSLKNFNDLHGVHVDDDHIYVCNTGLEIVQVFDHDFRLIDEINMATTPTYDRFDQAADYRMIATTKPHETHINHIFCLDDEKWVTRGLLTDAIKLHDAKERFDLQQVGRGPNDRVICHDGIVRDERIYFTTVNGHIVAFDIHSRKQILDIDAREVVGQAGYGLGWVRGLEVIGNRAFLGTTKIRSSTFKEYTRWIVYGEERKMPSSILEIDMDQLTVRDVYQLENYEGHAIYSIIKNSSGN